MLVWGTYNYSYSYLASFPSSCIVHNNDTMIIQVYYLLVFYYMYVHVLISQCTLIVLKRSSIDNPLTFNNGLYTTTHFSY